MQTARRRVANLSHMSYYDALASMKDLVPRIRREMTAVLERLGL